MENNFRFASASVSDRGLSDKRPVNEDSFLEISELGLFAVADGVGGAQAGDFASQMAMETLGEAFRNLPNNFDAEQALKVAIQHANQSIFTMSNELPQLSSMATTVAALHINGNIATIAHVGDSRVYRIEPDGTLKRETADHSVVEEEVRAGRMTPEQALVHPSRNIISRALGAEESVNIDLKTIMVEPGTMFLLCSDGITRHIEDRELETIFQEEIEPQVLCEQMRSICYSRGAEDNLTAVVVRVAGQIAASNWTSTTGKPPERSTFQSTEIGVEEETVATARSPFDEPIIKERRTAVIVDEEPGHSPSDDEDTAYLLDESLGREGSEVEVEPAVAAATVSAPPAVEIPRPVEPAPIRETAATPFGYALESEERRKGGGAFQSILFLLLGGVLGFAALWFWQQYNPVPAVPVLTETKSNNIPLTAFEEARREVDRDPARYLAANAATPQDAEDHYLLGRAQLLTGKYVEARQQFSLAKARLTQVDSANAKTLAADVALASAIAENQALAEAFAKEVSAPPQSTGASNLNANTNLGANLVNQPLR